MDKELLQFREDSTRQLRGQVSTLKGHRTVLCVVCLALFCWSWDRHDYARRLESAIRRVVDADASGEPQQLGIAIMEATEAMEDSDRERE